MDVWKIYESWILFRFISGLSNRIIINIRINVWGIKVSESLMRRMALMRRRKRRRALRSCERLRMSNRLMRITRRMLKVWSFPISWRIFKRFLISLRILKEKIFLKTYKTLKLFEKYDRTIIFLFLRWDIICIYLYLFDF